MHYALLTMHDENYRALAEITVNNKNEYCHRHGYSFFLKNKNFSQGRHIYFDKIRYNLEILENNPQLSWIWWLDCDAVITNFTIPFAKFCDDQYDFVIAVDRYAINNGSYFIKNSSLARQFLYDVLALEEVYLDHQWPEQQPMIDLIEMDDDYRAMTKIHPQRDFNSFDYDFYHRDHGNTHDWDITGANGNWQPGDFVCHYPGIKYETKIDLAKKILEQIVR